MPKSKAQKKVELAAAAVGCHYVHRHGLQRWLYGPETVAQQQGRCQVAGGVVHEHQQQYADNDGGVARIYEYALSPVGLSPCPWLPGEHRGNGDADKSRCHRWAKLVCLVHRWSHTPHDAVSHHEEELGDGGWHRVLLEQLVYFQRFGRQLVGAVGYAEAYQQASTRGCGGYGE